jgi:uncharacterized membrane protein
MYNYIKALHIVFIVTWFSGMFYIVRLFIYNTEAGDKDEPERSILRKQFTIMIKRLWNYLAIGYCYTDIWSARVVATGRIARLATDKTVFCFGVIRLPFFPACYL